MRAFPSFLGMDAVRFPCIVKVRVEVKEGARVRPKLDLKLAVVERFTLISGAFDL